MPHRLPVIVRMRESIQQGIRGAVEVIGGVDWTLHLLPTSVEHPLARAEPNEALVQLVLVVKVLRKTIAVTERAVDGASGPPIGRLQVITVQVVSSDDYPPVRTRIIGGSARTLDDALVSARRSNAGHCPPGGAPTNS